MAGYKVKFVFAFIFTIIIVNKLEREIYFMCLISHHI